MKNLVKKVKEAGETGVLGLRVGIRVIRVWGLWLGAWGRAFRVWGFGLLVLVLGFRGLGSEVCGLALWA